MWENLVIQAIYVVVEKAIKQNGYHQVNTTMNE